MNPFIIDLSDLLGVPTNELIDYTENPEKSLLELPDAPNGYIMEYGEFGVRIEMSDLDFDYRWSGRNFTKPEQIKHMDEGFQFIQKIFPASIHHLRICPTWMDHFGMISGECEVMTLGNDSAWYTEPDLQKIPEVGKLDITKLLNNVNVKKGLALVGPKELRTDHKTLYFVDWLRVNQCQWMKVAHLKRLRNKVISLSDVTFTDSEVREYLLNLKNDPANDKLNFLRMERETADPWNPEDIIKGLKTTQVTDQQFDLGKFDEKIYFDDFLPTTDDFIEIAEGYEFIKSNKTRVIIEFKEEIMTIFVQDRKPEKRKMLSDEENPISERRMRYD